jgi:murein DD-endopeptidase MepM/ murein hydrolase activator NlpD
MKDMQQQELKLTNASKERGGMAFALLLLVFFFSIVSAGVFGFIQISHTNPLTPFFLETTPPSITWIQEPVGFGADPATVSFEVLDEGAGLDEIIVRLAQNNAPKAKQLKRITIDQTGVSSQRVDFTIDPKALLLREGKAEITILAFDKSLWNNSSKIPKTVEVNFSKPHIEVVTPQQNGVIGGTELVFYKVTGKRPYAQGVTSNGSLYPGFQAQGWDASFQSNPELYLSFYPMPVTFDEQRDVMALSARDEIGNSATANFNYRAKQRRYSSFKLQFSQKDADLLSTSFGAYARAAGLKIKPSGDTNADLATLIKVLTRHDESVLSDTWTTVSSTRHWRGAFLRPVTTYPTNTSGDTRLIAVDKTEILKNASLGVRFATPNRTSVVAANAGVVLFTGELGTLGRAVIIDHGLGLTTLYAHLSEVLIKEKEGVKQGQPIARTGKTGLSPGEEVYFETRVHGVPVSPNEWWDETWINDHIEAKVAFVQRTILGQEPG